MKQFEEWSVKLLFSLSKDNGDFIVEFYNGTGNG